MSHPAVVASATTRAWRHGEQQTQQTHPPQKDSGGVRGVRRPAAAPATARLPRPLGSVRELGSALGLHATAQVPEAGFPIRDRSVEAAPAAPQHRRG